MLGPSRARREGAGGSLPRRAVDGRIDQRGWHMLQKPKRDLAYRIVAVVGALVLLTVAIQAEQPGHNDALVLTGGFQDHLEPVDTGRIDWANGYILAEGIGRVTGASEQERLMARRAGEVVAARNALAMAQGIRIDANGRVGQVRDGLVRVRGWLRGHKVVESHWLTGTDPPECKVTLRVPLWGVRGLSSLFLPSHRARLDRSASRRLALVVSTADVSDFVLVLDARGRGLSPCLFPEIFDADGKVLYDLRTLSEDVARRHPPARYVESVLDFEQLQAAVESNGRIWFMLASAAPRDPPDDTRIGQQETTSQPTDKPSTAPSRRRAKRRMAVRVAEIAGAQKTQLVLTQEDAQRLRRSPDAAGALKNAQVLVVVDAPAAGSEGRLPLSDFPDGAHVRAHP